MITLGTDDVNALTASSGTLGITSGELNTVTAGTIIVGNTSAGNLSVTAAIAPTGTNILHLISNGTITQTTNIITVSNLAAEGAGGVTLNANNSVGTVAGDASGSGNAFSFTNSGALTVGTVDSVVGIVTKGGVVSVTDNTAATAITVSNAIDTTSAGTNTGGAAINLTADDLVIGAVSNYLGTSGVATLKAYTSGTNTDIGLGSTVADLNLSTAEINTFSNNGTATKGHRRNRGWNTYRRRWPKLRTVTVTADVGVTGVTNLTVDATGTGGKIADGTAGAVAAGTLTSDTITLKAGQRHWCGTYNFG